MKIFVLMVITCLLLSTPLTAQNISFDDQGWNSNQSLDSNFTIDNFLFSGSKSFYTNYGYDFDVYKVSIYFVFQDPAADQFTINSINNELYNLISLAAYQVSEASTDTLIIEGWNGATKKYTSKFLNINTWQILTLNYYNINKLVIKFSSSDENGISDFNFDNFLYIEPASSESPELNSYSLNQNYPNPFNPETVISWQLAVGSKVTLKIYDILGNEITTLVNEEQQAGVHSINFSSNSGSRSTGNAADLSSGVVPLQGSMPKQIQDRFFLKLNQWF